MVAPTFLRLFLLFRFAIVGLIVEGLNCTMCHAQDVHHVMSGFEAATQPWASCSFQAECTGEEFFSTRPKQVSIGRSLFDCKLEGDLFDIAITSWGHWQGESDTRPTSFKSSDGSLDRNIWDGHQYYTYTEMPSANSYLIQISSPKATLKDNTARAVHNRIIETPNSPLTQVFPGDSIPFTKIIDMLPPEDVKCDSEVLDGENCQVIDAKSKSGTYKLWIDSGRDSCLVKAIVHKAVNDGYYEGHIGDPLLPSVAAMLRANEFPSSSTKEFIFELDHVKVEKLAGI
jgi:hypothetical protein